MNEEDVHIKFACRLITVDSIANYSVGVKYDLESDSFRPCIKVIRKNGEVLEEVFLSYQRSDIVEQQLKQYLREGDND